MMVLHNSNLQSHPQITVKKCGFYVERAQKNRDYATQMRISEPNGLAQTTRLAHSPFSYLVCLLA